MPEPTGKRFLLVAGLISRCPKATQLHLLQCQFSPIVRHMPNPEKILSTSVARRLAAVNTTLYSNERSGGLDAKVNPGAVHWVRSNCRWPVLLDSVTVRNQRRKMNGRSRCGTSQFAPVKDLAVLDLDQEHVKMLGYLHPPFNGDVHTT